MIYVIECQHDEWKHKTANASFLIQLYETFHDEQITFYAKKRHIYEVKKELPGLDILYCELGELAYKIENVDIDNVNDYKIFLSDLFANIGFKQGDRVYFSNSSRGFFGAISAIISEYSFLKVYAVLHDFSERLIPDGMKKEEIPSFTLKESINMYLKCQNTYLITLSPCALPILKEMYHEFEDRIINIHLLPYENKESERKDNKNRIIVYGASINQYAIDITKQAIASHIDTVNMLLVVRKERKLVFSRYLPKNIAFYEKNYFEEEELSKLIKRTDWILIPYSKDMYKMTASGIFQDAIMYKKPILALNSNYLTYYNDKYNIGIVCNTIDELIMRLYNLPSGEEYNQYVNNYYELEKDLRLKNKNELRKIR